MKELDLQGQYVMDFFCRRPDGLGFREVSNNLVTPDLFIPSDLEEFLKNNSHKAWNSLLRKSDYKGDEQKLMRDIMNFIKEKIEASANVAIFLNANRSITFAGETLQLIYVSGTELSGDTEFEKNIFSAVEEVSYAYQHEGKARFKFRPDISFFVNGIYLGYAELKSNFNNQTSRKNGRGKVITDYLEAVMAYTEIADGNDVSQKLRRQMLRPFEKSLHLVATDIQDTYILRNPGQFFDELKKGFTDETLTISAFRPVVEKVFKPLPVKNADAVDPRQRFEEAMRSLYAKKMIEKEILYYNFMAYTYKTVTVTENRKKVQKKDYKDRRGTLICPRPKQKFGCDRILERVGEFMEHEKEPHYYIQKLRKELEAIHAPKNVIQRLVEERDSYCNNKYVYSLLLQYAAGFGKSNIIGWTALQLKDFRYNNEWVYDKILLVVDRLQLRDQLDSMMLNMNIDKAMFVEAKDQDTFIRALKDSRRIIVVNIQKFWDLQNAIDKAGADFTSLRVAFLIDEIHRSNTDGVHQEMFNAFDALQDLFDEENGRRTKGSTKKNLIVGFTATPSDRVLARFGEFHRGENWNQVWKPFDAYTMQEAIEDGYILDPTKHIIPVPAKMYFELPEDVQQAIREAQERGEDWKVANDRRQIYANKERMKAISEFIVKRLLSLVYGKIHGQGKAMLAVSSIPNAIQYAKIIRKKMKKMCASGPAAKYADAPISIIYSDSQEYEKCSKLNDGLPEDKVIDNFKTAKNGLIIVVDKLQTGFDEPKLHTLFLDKEIRDINAIQTISRVNRKCKYKEECHIIDFSFENVNVENIKEAYLKYSGVRISDFEPMRKKVELATLYDNLVQQPIYKRWFSRFSEEMRAPKPNAQFFLDMGADIRSWITAEMKAHEEYLHDHPEEAKTDLGDAATLLKVHIGEYNTLLGLLQGIIEMEKEYSDSMFLDFWMRYCNIFRAMFPGKDTVGEVVVSFDHNLGLVVDELEDVPGGRSGGNHRPPTGKKHPNSLEAVIRKVETMNDNQQVIEEQINFWKAEREGFFAYLHADGKFMAMLPDANFEREALQKAYDALVRRFNRMKSTDSDVKKWVLENKEALFEEFRLQYNPEDESGLRMATDSGAEKE